MRLEYAEISEAISLQPLHLIDEISHRVVHEYTEAICALGQAAMAARDIQAQLALTTAATRLRAQVEAQPAEESQPSADAPEKLSFQPVPGETWSSDTLTGEESGDAPSRGGESVEDSSGDEPGEPRS